MDEKAQDLVKGNMNKKANNNPYREMDWKKEPPRFGTSHGTGPRSPMKPRRDGSGLRDNGLFGNGGPNRNGGNP